MMFRNFRDYSIYLFRLQKRETITLIIDLIIFIASLSTLFSEWSNLIENISVKSSLIIVLILSIIKFIYDIYGIFDELQQYIQLRYGEIFAEPYDIEKIVSSKLEKNLEYKQVQCIINKRKNDYVFTSDKINKYIRENPLNFEINKMMGKNIRRYIKENKNKFIPFLKWQYRISMFYGKGFFNEKKLCLSKDIINNYKKISCHKGTYYDTYLTNQICGKKLISNKDDTIIADAVDILPFDKWPDGRISLKDITSSMMNNEIGISTLGITNDNYIVIWTQNRSAQSSNGFLVPTGSGSCDFADADDGGNFKKTIEGAMQRELWEESGRYNFSKTYKDIGETKVLGFFRWIVKGGKPEFVGITKLKNDLTSFYEDKSEVFNREEIYLASFDDLKKAIADIRNMPNVSVPLFMNLYCLEKYYEENPKELEEFLFPKQ